MVLKAKGFTFKEIRCETWHWTGRCFSSFWTKAITCFGDEGKVLEDSIDIIRHLEKRNTLITLLPKDSNKLVQVNLIGDWADTTLASAVRENLSKALVADQDLRTSFLDANLPKSCFDLLVALPLGIVGNI